MPTELATRIAAFMPADGAYETSIAGLTLYRAEAPLPPTPVLYQPALCVIAQGKKRVLLANESYVYDASKFMLIAADVPVTGQVFVASTRAPYLALRLALEPAIVGELIAELPRDTTHAASPQRALVVSRLDAPLSDAVLRLVGLLGEPRAQAVMAPLLKREIMFRLLVGEQGQRLRQIATHEGQAQRITHALQWLQAHFAEPLRIDRLARVVKMSASALHHHFKSVTAMSPLQYQKALRLREARRLMLAEGLDAAEASFRVGYESPTQFSREYRRYFGAPPRRDVSQLRDTPAPSSA